MAKSMRWGKRFGPGIRHHVTPGKCVFAHHWQPGSLKSWGMPRPWLHKRPIEETIRKTQKISLNARKAKGIVPSMPKFSFEDDTTDEQKILAAAAKAIPGGDAQEIFLVQGGASFVSVTAKGKRFTVIVNNQTKRVEDVEGPE